MNFKAPGIVSSCNCVWSGEQCGAGAAKPWLDCGDQPEVVRRNQHFPVTFSHRDGHLVISKKAEGSLAWGSGADCVDKGLVDTDAQAIILSPFPVVLNPVSFTIQLPVYFGDSGCRVEDTHSELLCILSSSAGEQGFLSHAPTAPRSVFGALAGSLSLRGKDEAHEGWTIITYTCGPVCFTWGSQSAFWASFPLPETL